MRLKGGLFVLVALAGAIACSSGSSTSEPSPTGSEGEVDASIDSSDAGAKTDSAGDTDAPGTLDADATLPANACGNASGPTATSCTIEGACGLQHCNQDQSAVRVNCGGTSRPPVEGCALIGAGPGGEGTDWCCPSSCVPNETPLCSGGKKLFFCPYGDAGYNVRPATACEKVASGGSGDAYCCP